MYVVLGECELVTGIEEEELTLNEREGIYTSPSMALTALHTRSTYVEYLVAMLLSWDGRVG